MVPAPRETRHVVWDWNGTLVNDLFVLLAAVNDVLKDLALPAIDVGTYRSQFTRPVHVFYERLLGRRLEAQEWERIDHLFHAGYRRRLNEVTLAPDAMVALHATQRQGLSQSLLSMWRHGELISLVAAMGIQHFFVRIDGLRGAGGTPKADHLAAHVRALQRQVRIEPAQVLVVGDTLDDAAAACELGTACVLYDSGSHHRDALEGTGLPVAGSLVEAVTGMRR